MMQKRPERADHLPEAVLQLANRLGCATETPLNHVQFRQVGHMRRDQASAWMPFTARQRITVSECAFEWKAQTGPMGLVQIRDAFDAGHGSLSVALFGVMPIVRVKRSAELDRGELMRYLAELPWAPDAMLLNPELHWRTVDDTHLVVTTGSGTQRAEITLTLDSEGRITEAFAKDRPRAVNNHFVPTAWRGVFSEYRRCAGRLLPMSAEVCWELEGGYEPMWRGRIVEWRAV